MHRYPSNAPRLCLARAALAGITPTQGEWCAKRAKAWCQSEGIDKEGQRRPRATLNKGAIKTAWPSVYVRGTVVPMLSDLVGRYAFMA